MATDSSGPENSSHQIRIVIQQCVSARLQLNATDGPKKEDPIYSNINHGVVVFVCFKKGAKEDAIGKVARSILEAKLSYSKDKKGLCSVLELGRGVMIVPQACLAGKLKGKSVQYHDLSGKEEGEALYHKFVDSCKEYCSGKGTTVVSGTYGNRQVLTMETEGPFTHIFDF